MSFSRMTTPPITVEEEEEEGEKIYDLIIRCIAQMGNTFHIKREKI